MSLLRLYDSTETVHIDFDWIYDEIKNLKDVPREFDEDFLREVEISDTVLNYWKEIGFSPGYFQRFMLFNWRARGYTYREHRAKCMEMLPFIMEENEKIGKAIADYYEAEDKALEWFCTPRDGYIYELSDWYDDESGGALHMSTSWEEVYEYMKMDSEEGGDNSYFICRYSLKNETLSRNLCKSFLIL